MKDLLFSACLLVKKGEIDNTVNIFLYILQFKNICLRFCVLPGLSHCSSALHCAVSFIYIIFCIHDFHDTAAIGCFFFFFLISVMFSTLMKHCNDAVSGKWQKKESKQKRREGSLYSGTQAQSCSVNCRPHVALIQCVYMCVNVCT